MGSILGVNVGTLDGVVVGIGVGRPATYDGSVVGDTVGTAVGTLEGRGVGLPGR